MSNGSELRAPGIVLLEPAQRRRRAVLLLVALALVSPDIALPGTLPAIRLEQVALLVLLPGIVLYHVRNPSARDLGPIDLAFALFGASTIASIVLGPVITGRLDWSLRDSFDVVRLAGYWVVYRLARTLDGDELSTSLRRLLLVAGLLIGLLGLVQYLHPPGFNEIVTALWTSGHNLDGVEQAGRIVGTSGNANEFGLLSQLVLLLAILELLTDSSGRTVARPVAVATVMLAVFGLVGAQSRTALVAAAVGFAFVGIVSRAGPRPRPAGQWRRRVGVASLIVASLAASVFVLVALPPRSADVANRFSLSALVTDPSVVIRFANLRAILGLGSAAPAEGPAGAPCSLPRQETNPYPGHDAIAAASGPQASPEVRARDLTRKQDVARIAAAVAAYLCRHAAWPTTGTLGDVLVPEELDAVPHDPSGKPYRFYVGTIGFLVGADLEDATDPSGPIFTMGTTPSMIIGSSFDTGGQIPAGWGAGGGATTANSGSDRLFGSTALHVGLPTTTSWIYQYVVFAFPKDHEFSAAVWAHAVGSTGRALELRVVTLSNDGVRRDPFATRDIVLPEDGSWVRPTITFRTPETERIVTVEIMIRVPHGGTSSQAVVDGASLNEGPFPASYTTLRDVDPAQIRLPGSPSFSDSPILGVGPVRDEQLGAIDNEYAYLLLHQGVVGVIAFLGLLAAFVVTGIRAWRAAEPAGRVSGLLLAGLAVSIAVFDLANGVLRNSQVMLIALVLAGASAGALQRSRLGSATVARTSRDDP